MDALADDIVDMRLEEQEVCHKVIVVFNMRHGTVSFYPSLINE